MSKWVRRSVINPTGSSYGRLVNNILGNTVISALLQSEASGTVANDHIAGKNGTYSNVTLANVTGPGGFPAPYYNGTSGFINWINAASVLNGQEGGLITWIKFDTGVWTDSTNRRPFRFAVDANNYLFLRRETTNNALLLSYNAGATTKNATLSINPVPSNWFVLRVGWSKAGDFLKLSINEKEYTSTTGVGTWVGTPTSMTLGASDATPQQLHKGWLSSTYLTNQPISQAQERSYMAASPLIKRMSVLGDSIAAGNILATHIEWPLGLQMAYNNGITLLTNHAESSMGVVVGAHNLAYQAAQTASDNADIILIALGSNDNNGGNMTTLQAAVESGIDVVRSHNPRATVYYVGPPPRWTDVSGATEVDLSNIRTAIKAGCLAKSVTYIDMYDTPVFVVADTVDGTHPITSGYTKMLTTIAAVVVS